MKLIDALEMSKTADQLPQDARFVGIRLGYILITPEMLESKDWGCVIENNDPEFTEAVKGLAKILQEQGPVLTEPYLRIIK